MSNRCVLVGRAAKLPARLPHAPSARVCAAPWLQAGLLPFLSPPRRLFHATNCRPSSQGSRQPRAFHITPSQPPSILPSPSSASSPSSISSPSPPLSEEFRTIMRLLTYPVVVCTSTDPSPTPSLPRNESTTSTTSTPRAMTMSSFTSLALHPTPVVSFNIAVPSRTYDAVAASRHFNLHVLADDAPGAAIADWFARGNYTERGSEEDMFGKLVASGLVESVSLTTATLSPVGGRDYTEAPVLHGDGILFVLRCKLLDDEPARGLVKVRDHILVLGEVLEVVQRAGVKKQKQNQFGLLYADRKYRQLGGCITPAGPLEDRQ